MLKKNPFDYNSGVIFIEKTVFWP